MANSIFLIWEPRKSEEVYVGGGFRFEVSEVQTQTSAALIYM